MQWRGIYFSRGDYRCIYYTFLSCNKRFSFRPLFLDVKLFSLPTCRYIFELAQSCCLWLGSHAYCLRYDYIFIGLTCLLSSVWFLFHWTHMLTVFDMITFSFGSHAYYLRYDYIFVGLTRLLSSVWLHFLWAHVLVVFGMITFLLGSHAYCLRYDYFFVEVTCLLSSLWLLFYWGHMLTVFGMTTCSCFHSVYNIIKVPQPYLTLSWPAGRLCPIYR